MVEKWSKKQYQKLKISRVTPESWDQGQVRVTVLFLGGFEATKPDGCRTPNINVTVYPACKLQYTCRQSSQMVILGIWRISRISNVHVAKLSSSAWWPTRGRRIYIYIYTNPRYVPYIFPCVFLNLWSQNPLCVSLIWFKEACLWRHLQSPLFQFQVSWILGHA